MESFWKVIYRIISGTLTLGVIAWVVLLIWLVWEPYEANPETGHIIPFNNHGGIHYITKTEDFLLFWLMPFNFVLALCLAEIKWRHKGEFLGKGDKDYRL